MWVARFFQYHPHLAAADAIGYSILALHRELKQAGHASFVACRYLDTSMIEISVLKFTDLSDVAWQPDDVLILHHSFVNPDLARLLAFPVRKIAVYHNITPSKFFYDINMPEIGDQAEAARLQLTQIAAAVQIAIGDSDYNSSELPAYGFKRRATIPVFYNDAFFRSPNLDWPLYEELKTSGAVNIVFIGRLVPNKRVDRVIEAVAEYARLFRREIHLHLIGKIFDQAYTAGLIAKAAQLRILPSLRLHWSVEPMRLKTVLAAADAFLCFSEHEGFMVPVVEAFAVGCPVIAQRNAAVGETMGGAGLAIDDSDPALIAGLIELLRRDKQSRQAIVFGQFRRALDFRTDLTAERWMSLLHREFDMPFPSPPC